MTQTTQYKDKFDALAKSVQVQPDEQSIAEFFWYAGLRHAFQRGTSQPALLQPQVPPRGKEMSVNYQVNVHDYNKGYSDGRKSVHDRVITPREAQMLKVGMKDVIKSTVHDIQRVNDVIDHYWTLSDKDDSNTEYYFKQLNIAKNTKRKLQKELEKYQVLQAKFKKLAKGI